MSDKEIRSFEVREVGNEFVEGYAAVFGCRSELLGNFYEEIESGAFSSVLNDDVFALFNHDSNLPLARTANGSLQLEQDTHGLKVRFKLPNTTLGNDIRELLRTGMLTKMSFAFSVAGDSWRKLEDGTPLRTIKKVSRLFDISPVVMPAYPDTSISIQARSMADEVQNWTDLENDAPTSDDNMGDAAMPTRVAERERILKLISRGKFYE